MKKHLISSIFLMAIATANQSLANPEDIFLRNRPIENNLAVLESSLDRSSKRTIVKERISKDIPSFFTDTENEIFNLKPSKKPKSSKKFKFSKTDTQTAKINTQPNFPAFFPNQLMNMSGFGGNMNYPRYSWMPSNNNSESLSLPSRKSPKTSDVEQSSSSPASNTEKTHSSESSAETSARTKAKASPADSKTSEHVNSQLTQKSSSTSTENTQGSGYTPSSQKSPEKHSASIQTEAITKKILVDAESQSSVSVGEALVSNTSETASTPEAPVIIPTPPPPPAPPPPLLPVSGQPEKAVDVLGNDYLGKLTNQLQAADRKNQINIPVLVLSTFLQSLKSTLNIEALNLPGGQLNRIKTALDSHGKYRDPAEIWSSYADAYFVIYQKGEGLSQIESYEDFQQIVKLSVEAYRSFKEQVIQKVESHKATTSGISIQTDNIFFSDKELNIDDQETRLNIARWFAKTLKNKLAPKLPSNTIPASNTYKDEAHLKAVVQKIIEASTNPEFLRQIEQAEEVRQAKAQQQAALIQHKTTEFFTLLSSTIDQYFLNHITNEALKQQMQSVINSHLNKLAAEKPMTLEMISRGLQSGNYTALANMILALISEKDLLSLKKNILQSEDSEICKLVVEAAIDVCHRKLTVAELKTDFSGIFRIPLECS